MRLATAAVCAILLAAAPARDKPMPNALTPKEIADGWLLLFDGETTFGWKIDGEAEVKDGALVLSKEKRTLAVPTTTFQHFRLEFEWDGHGSVFWNNTEGRLLPDSGNPAGGWLTCAVESGPKEVVMAYKGSGGPPKTLNEKPGGEHRLTFTPDAHKELRIRNVKLRPLSTNPLFDGKALDGWKVNAADPKRMASKFEVTKDGELSVKNGPGDLVTEKEFANFVLQFECKTLGDGLNSGFFFRCIPGQYQNGYEAQVQNSYLDNDRTKPKDFGTGAIYRRIASRKVVSNDKEWFTMTVVADGKHIATWVNGYQTVDWTDDRKDDENPRKGYRAAKGPISIQGHDPTTDLLFRNIRIASW